MKATFFDVDVREWIDSLERTTRSHAYHVIRLLEEFGYQLRLPQSRSLGSGLFELRVRGVQEIRLFYTFFDNQAVLLCGFVKKTRETPVKELQKAKQRKKMLTSI